MATWQYHETKLLLQLWADRNVQEQLSSSGRKKPLWNNLSKEMKNAGFDRTGTQCKTRIHNLAQRYKKEKRLVGQTGQERSGWTFFEDIDLVLGCKPSAEPSVMLESTKGLIFKEAGGDAGMLEDDEYAEMPEIAEDLPTEAEFVPNSTSDDEAPGPSTGNMTRETKRKRGKGTAGAKLEGFMIQMLLMQEESEKRFYEAERRREEHEAKQEEKRQKFEADQDAKREDFLLKVLQTLTKPNAN